MVRFPWFHRLEEGEYAFPRQGLFIVNGPGLFIHLLLYLPSFTNRKALNYIAIALVGRALRFYSGLIDKETGVEM